MSTCGNSDYRYVASRNSLAESVLVFVIPAQAGIQVLSLCFPGFRLSHVPARSAGMTPDIVNQLTYGTPF